MIRKIKNRTVDYNNDASISNSSVKTNIKLIYYGAILALYKVMRFTITNNKVQANSSWTHAHMQELWGNKNIKKLYPPCSIEKLLKYGKSYGEVTSINKIVSLAQFRP